MSDYNISLTPDSGDYSQGGFVFLSGADPSDSRFIGNISGSWAGEPGNVSITVQSFSYNVTNQGWTPWNVIDDILVDGTSIGYTGAEYCYNYTFSGVVGDHTLSATFKPKDGMHTVTVHAENHGSILPFGVPTENDSPTGVVPLLSGSSETFHINSWTDGTIEDVLVDGVSVGSVTGYTFTNIDSDHTISASFD